MSIPRTVYKMHATGNDFVVYADPQGTLEPSADQVRWLCDRHFGVGADGVIRLAHPQDVSDLDQEAIEGCNRFGCQWFMDYRNADGSLAQMCGNGTRAITLFAQKQGLAPTMDGSSFLLGTRAGVKRIVSRGAASDVDGHVFTVNIGAWTMGALGGQMVDGGALGGSAPGTLVDMGNPHVVVLAGLGEGFARQDSEGTGVDGNGAGEHSLPGGLPGAVSTLLGKTELPDLDTLDLGRQPNAHPGLDEGQNIEFLRLESVDPQTGSGHASMRVYERGVGETLSCGTGLSASGVVLRVLTGLDHWAIRVGGGVLDVDVDDQEVHLTGEARMVARVSLEDIPRGLA